MIVSGTAKKEHKIRIFKHLICEFIINKLIYDKRDQISFRHYANRVGLYPAHRR